MTREKLVRYMVGRDITQTHYGRHRNADGGAMRPKKFSPSRTSPWARW